MFDEDSSTCATVAFGDASVHLDTVYFTFGGPVFVHHYLVKTGSYALATDHTQNFFTVLAQHSCGDFGLGANSWHYVDCNNQWAERGSLDLRWVRRMQVCAIEVYAFPLWH